MTQGPISEVFSGISDKIIPFYGPTLFIPPSAKTANTYTSDKPNVSLVRI